MGDGLTKQQAADIFGVTVEDVDAAGPAAYSEAKARRVMAYRRFRERLALAMNRKRGRHDCFLYPLDSPPGKG